MRRTNQERSGDSTDNSSGNGEARQRHLLEWERLVLEVSNSLVRQDAETLDDAIQHALARLGHYASADRCYVFRHDASDDTMSNTHEWCVEGIEPQKEHLQRIPSSAWPYWMEQLRNEGIVDWPSVASLPAAGCAEREALAEQQVKAVVAVPMIDGETLTGFVGFDSVRSQRFWQHEEIYLLRMSANVVGSAIARLRAERELQLARDSIAHTTRLESLGRFVGGTAHDFNNLLAVILGNCELSHASADVVALREHIDQIEQAGERAAALTRKLLTFGRRRSVEFADVPINDAILQSYDFVDRLLGDAVELQTDLDPASGFVRADAGQLQNLLLNLAANARDAMPFGGTITISTRHVRGASNDSGSVQLTVADTGQGMDPDTVKRAFEPFFTTKDPLGGTGLGLSSVYGIVTQANGDIRIASEPGTGTTVEILLPQVLPTAQTESVALDESPSQLLQGIQALVVDDDVNVLKVLEAVLRRAGCHVLKATGASEALSVLSDANNAADVVVTDSQMPKMTGIQLINALRESGNEVPFVVISGNPEELFNGGLQDRTDVRLLAKPFDGTELVNSINEALFRQQQ